MPNQWVDVFSVAESSAVRGSERSQVDRLMDPVFLGLHQRVMPGPLTPSVRNHRSKNQMCLRSAQNRHLK